MIKEIRFGGFSTVPSDYDCPDQDLALSFGLLNEHGLGLRNIPGPKDLGIRYPLPGGHILSPDDRTAWFCIHSITEQQRKHYVVACALKDDYFLMYYDGQTFHQAGELRGEPSSIVAVGRVLAVAYTDSATPMEYFIWKGEGYVPLGSRPPVPVMQFGLQFAGGGAESSTVTFTNYSRALGNLFTQSNGGREPSGPSGSITADEKAGIKDCFHTVVNKALDNASKQGLLCFPFLIRTALRLFDGSYAWHSGPVLLVPSTDTPNALTTYTRDGDDITIKMTLGTIRGSIDDGIGCINPCRIMYRLLPFDKEQFGAWEDIITSMDVFITPQVYQYASGEDVSIGIEHLTDKSAYFGTFSLPVVDSEWKDNAFDIGKLCTKPKAIENSTLSSQIASLANFYRVSSIPFNEIVEQVDMKALDLDTKDLRNIVTRPTLPDDFRSRDDLSPRLATSYNSRLHVSRLTCTPAPPYSPACMLHYAMIAGGKRQTVKVTVLLKKNGKIVSRSIEGEGEEFTCYDLASGQVPRFLFYPDADAYRMILSQGEKHYYFNLKNHDFLNGAYWVDERLTPSDVASTPLESLQVPDHCEASYSMPGKIYVAEVANPFVYRPQSAVSIPVGDVLGLASAAQALSQGQFGQYPLYAFTDEGVWALELSSTGTYLARQPITRDVCLSPTGILSIDSAVLFTTRRGIMMLAGSEATCLTDGIYNDPPFDATALPGLDVFYLLSGLKKEDVQTKWSLLQYLCEAAMIYDYPGQRLIVYNPLRPYAYVYSFRSRCWGYMPSQISQHLASYPQALAVTHDGRLVDYAQTGDTSSSGIMVTRPWKLDAPDLLKTLRSMAIRGDFPRGAVNSVLYGSRDLRHWYVVSSSRDNFMRRLSGTPYKYFRLALLSRLGPDDSISGASVEFFPRQTNKLR